MRGYNENDNLVLVKSHSPHPSHPMYVRICRVSRPNMNAQLTMADGERRGRWTLDLGIRMANRKEQSISYNNAMSGPQASAIEAGDGLVDTTATLRQALRRADELLTELEALRVGEKTMIHDSWILRLLVAAYDKSIRLAPRVVDRGGFAATWSPDATWHALWQRAPACERAPAPTQ